MHSVLSRRRFLGVLGGAVFVSAATLSATRPGVDSVAALTFISGTPGPVDPGDQVLLRIHNEGGFVPVEYPLTAIPTFSLYAGGRAITTGPMIEIFPQPALPNLRELKLSGAGIARVLAEAKAADLTDGPNYYGSTKITDVQTTYFTYNDGAISNTVSAYALGFDEQLIANPEDLEARAKLIELQSFLMDLTTNLAPEEVAEPDKSYEIEQIRIYAQVYDPSTVDDELEQPPMPWPLETALSVFGNPLREGPLSLNTRCGALTGDEATVVVEALTKANQLTPWESKGEQYRLWVRPLLPEESGCPDQ